MNIQIGFTVAWFTFDPLLTGPGLQYSEDSLSVSGEGWEHRVALGSVGFSRGVHYWEISIDKFDADTDPAFGIARIDVARDKMLGKFQLVSAFHVPLFHFLHFLPIFNKLLGDIWKIRSVFHDIK